MTTSLATEFISGEHRHNMIENKGTPASLVLLQASMHTFPWDEMKASLAMEQSSHFFFLTMFRKASL